MRGVRVVLVVGIVLAILAYLSVLVSGGGLGRRDGFTGVGPNDPIFTLFYMTGCPHCENIMPEFDKWAAAGQFMSNGTAVKIRKLERAEAGPLLDTPIVKIDEAGKEVPSAIEGFPTLVLSTADGKNIEYVGSRDVNGYEQFITKYIK